MLCVQREITRGNEEEFKAMLSELLTVDSLLRVYQVLEKMIEMHQHTCTDTPVPKHMY